MYAPAPALTRASSPKTGYNPKYRAERREGPLRGLPQGELSWSCITKPLHGHAQIREYPLPASATDGSDLNSAVTPRRASARLFAADAELARPPRSTVLEEHGVHELESTPEYTSENQHDSPLTYMPVARPRVRACPESTPRVLGSGSTVRTLRSGEARCWGIRW